MSERTGYEPGTPTEFGGGVMLPPGDIEGVGRFAVLTDPQGVMFGVVTAPPPGT